MNHCLSIPEIIALICNYVSDDISLKKTEDVNRLQPPVMPSGYHSADYIRGSSRSSQLHALARTCRRFQQPALENLWESIPGLSTLIKCIGKDVYFDWGEPRSRDRVHEVRLSSPITASDVEKMRKYTSFVRHCGYDHATISSEAWVALRNTFAGTVLFPKLQSLLISNDGMMKHAEIFGAQSLTSLTVACGARKSQPSMLVDFSTLCPGLSTFKLCITTGTGMLQGAIEALQNWPNLSQLMCKGTPDLLRAASHCPRLEHINFPKVDFAAPWTFFPAETNSRKNFPMLRAFGVTCDVMAQAIQLLDVFPPTVDFQSLHFNILGDYATCKEGWLGLIQSLTRYSHCLKELEIYETKHSVPCGIFTNNLLSNLATHFTALTRLKITRFGDHKLVDEDLKSLTEALPLLEEFQLLTFHSPEHYSIGTTMACLTFFARNCPFLTVLSIAFKGSGGVLESPEQFVPGLKLKQLDVFISLIYDEAELVADFLLCLFPNLRWMEWVQYRFSYVPVDVTYQQIHAMRSWLKVSKIIAKTKGLVE